MGRIPTVTSQIASRSGRTSQSVPSPSVSPDAFGASVGRAMQNLGAGINTAIGGFMDMRDARREEDLANAVAQADFTRRELELRNEVGPDGAGYQELTLEAYDEWVDQQAEAIEDDVTRDMFKRRMLSQRASLSSRAAQYELGTDATYSKDQANASLVTLDNRIRLNPDDYDEFIDQGFAVIDARTNVPAGVRAGMKEKWKESAALSRFEGMLERADTVEDVEAVRAELENTDARDWAAELSSAGMERVLNLTEASAKSIQSQADARARAALDVLESRAGDVSVTIPREELMAVQEVVDASNNPVTAARMARIVRDQELVERFRTATPAQVRNAARTEYDPEGAPPDFDFSQYAIGGATRPDSFTNMTVAMQSGLAQMLTAADAEIGTGLQVYSGYRSPALQAKLFADAVEKYGSEEAARKWVAPPGNSKHNTGQAADLKWNGVRLDAAPENVREWVKNNASRFGLEVPMEWEPWQVEEAGARSQSPSSVSPSQMRYEDQQTMSRIADEAERRLADDPMRFAVQTGVGVASDIFAAGGMEARGEEAAAVADYYNIPAADMKPFTNEEAQSIGTAFSNGSADEVLGILTSIQQMGGDMARAGMAQIAEVNDVYAYAGGLQLETGQGAVAAEVVRGQKRLDDNPDIVNQIGAAPRDISDAFLNATGGALMDAAPRQRQAIKDAAMAHYVETQVSKGRAGAFDTDMFSASVQAVLGGSKGSPALDEVNGAQTVLPPGVTGEALEDAFQNMTVADWTAMSEQGEPPRYITGQIADPEDLADEAQLRAIGGGRYRVVTSDGAYLITGKPSPNGQLEPYVFVPTADSIDRVKGREGEDRADRLGYTLEPTATGFRVVQNSPDPDQSDLQVDIEAARSDGDLTQEEIMALFDKYGYAAVTDTLKP